MGAKIKKESYDHVLRWDNGGVWFWAKGPRFLRVCKAKGAIRKNANGFSE
jgi:hypothetical protein